MISLDQNSKYKLTKIGIKDFSLPRHINEGETLSGEARVLPFDSGSVLLVTSGTHIMRTSPLVSTQDQGNGNYLVETKNSFYVLEKLNNEIT